MHNRSPLAQRQLSAAIVIDNWSSSSPTASWTERVTERVRDFCCHLTDMTFLGEQNETGNAE